MTGEVGSIVIVGRKGERQEDIAVLVLLMTATELGILRVISDEVSNHTL